MARLELRLDDARAGVAIVTLSRTSAGMTGELSLVAAKRLLVGESAGFLFAERLAVRKTTRAEHAIASQMRPRHRALLI